MTRIFLAIASIFGALTVASGALASHALKDRLTEKALSIFETGARYQMYHALALLMVALLLSRAEASQTFIVAGGWAFIVGIALVTRREPGNAMQLVCFEFNRYQVAGGDYSSGRNQFDYRLDKFSSCGWEF